jgi:hypothetical protein
MSALGHKQTLGPTRFHVCYALISRHGTSFINEDEYGARLLLNAPMRSTNPEKWDSKSQI